MTTIDFITQSFCRVDNKPKKQRKNQKHIQAKCHPSDMANPSLTDIVDTYNIKQIYPRRKGCSLWQIGLKGLYTDLKGKYVRYMSREKFPERLT